MHGGLSPSVNKLLAWKASRLHPSFPGYGRLTLLLLLHLHAVQYRQLCRYDNLQLIAPMLANLRIAARLLDEKVQVLFGQNEACYVSQYRLGYGAVLFKLTPLTLPEGCFRLIAATWLVFHAPVIEHKLSLLLISPVSNLQERTRFITSLCLVRGQCGFV